MNAENHIKMINFIKENSYNTTYNILDESAAEGLTDAVLDKIFVLTVGKYKKIDFSDIERSRGDITRFKHYENLKECINVLLDLHTSTNNIPGALTVSIALENLMQMKAQFERAFRVKNNMGIMIYNSYVYAIMEATSYLIASSVDFVKTDKTTANEADTFTVNIYADSKQNALINHLSRINSLIEDGSIGKFLNEVEKEANQSTQNESAITDEILKFGWNKAKETGSKAKNVGKIALISAAVILLAVNIVPLLKELVYWIYRCRQKISDAAALQSEFLETNIQIISQQGADEKIVARQEKHIKRLTSISRTFAVDADKAERDSKKDAADDKVDASAIVL